MNTKPNSNSVKRNHIISKLQDFMKQLNMK